MSRPRLASLVLLALCAAAPFPCPAQDSAPDGDVLPVLIPWPSQPAPSDEDDDELVPLVPPPPAALPPTSTSLSSQPPAPPGSAPAAPASPGSAAQPVASATPVPGATAKEPAKQPGTLTETELNVLVPAMEMPSVGARVAVTEMTPPTQDVRRWQFEKVEGLTWESEEALQEDDWVVLRGDVDVRAGIERIRAEEIRLNVKTRKLEAEGSVVLDRLDSRLTGRRLEYDTATNTGVMFDAMGFTADDLSFTADIAEKVSENKYVLRGATFTSCTQPAPIWQVNATKAVVEIDRFVYLWNPRVRFGKVPLSYLPWVAFPIKQDRATGFMIPRVSSSSRRGTSVSEDFFWAINRSTDLTVGGTWWEKFGWRADAQARWFLPGMNEYGFIEGVYLRANKGEEDPKLERERYLINWEHRQKLGEWDLTFTGEIGTDPLVDEFDGLLGNNTATTGSGIAIDRSPIQNQRLTLQRRWGKHSLNIQLESDERGQSLTTPPSLQPAPSPNFTAGDPLLDSTRTEINRSLPLVEWRASGIQIGGRKWAVFDLEGSLASLTRAREDEYEYPTLVDQTLPDRDVARLRTMRMDHAYSRADLFPQFSFPLSASFLRVIPEVNVRGTWWSRREIDGDLSTPLQADEFARDVPVRRPIEGAIREVRAGEIAGVDEGTFLWAWDAGVRVEGPDLERIFNADAEPGQKKWQHLIEPSIDYVYAPELDRVHLITGDSRAGHYSQRFPSQSTVVGRPFREGGTNEVRMRLVNTLRSKRVVPPGSTQDQARDLVIWTLSSTWDADRDEQEVALARKAHAEPLDCNDNGILGETGEGAGETCPGDRIEETRFASISSDVNFRPTDLIHFSLRNTYDTVMDDVTNTTLTGGLDWDKGYLDVAFSSSRTQRTLEANRTEASLTGEHWFYKGGRIRLGYDLTREIDPRDPIMVRREVPPGSGTFVQVPYHPTPWIYKRLVFSYYNQCVGLSLSWEDNAHRGVQREREWTFLVSLKELGNFMRYRRRVTDPPLQ